MCGERDGDSSRRGATGRHFQPRRGPAGCPAASTTVRGSATDRVQHRPARSAPTPRQSAAGGGSSEPESVPPAGHRAIGRATTLEGAPMAEAAGGGRSDGPDGSEHRTFPEATLAPGLLPVRRVGWGFIALYAAAYMGTSLMLVAPLLVTLALK